MRLRSLLAASYSSLSFFAVAAVIVSASAMAHMPSTPTGAGIIYNAGFESDSLTVGGTLPIGTGSDLPSSKDSNLIATVENSGNLPAGTPALNSTKFVRLKETCGEAPNLAFDRGVAFGMPTSPNDIVHVAFDVLFETLENYSIFFRNGSGSGIPGPSSQTVADIDTFGNQMVFSSFGGSTSITYQAGVKYHLDVFFDLGNNKWYVFVNGRRVVNGTSIIESPLGRIGIGFNFTSFCPPSGSFAGVLQFDAFVFQQVGAVPVPGVLDELGTPFGVAIHQGYAYVADPSAHTVWKVNLFNADDRTPVAGIGWKTDIDPQDRQGFNGDGIEAIQAQLDNPSGVAIDPSGTGTLYIADAGNHAIRKVPLGVGDGAVITTVAGVPTSYAVGENPPSQCAAPPTGFNTAQCLATNLRLFGPRGVAVDQSGNVYIADRMNQQIKLVKKATGFLSVVAGVAGETGLNVDGAFDGPAAGPAFCDDCTAAARFNSPVGVAVDSSGTVYVADEGNNQIRTVSGGNVATLQVFGLVRPTGVAVNSVGTIFIADYGRHIIRRATCGTSCTVETVVGTADEEGSGAGQLDSPIAITLDGNFLFIADMRNGRVVAVDVTPVIIF